MLAERIVGLLFQSPESLGFGKIFLHLHRASYGFSIENTATPTAMPRKMATTTTVRDSVPLRAAFMRRRSPRGLSIHDNAGSQRLVPRASQS